MAKVTSRSLWRQRLFWGLIGSAILSIAYYLTVTFGALPEFISITAFLSVGAFLLMVILAFITIPLTGSAKKKAQRIGQGLILLTIFFGVDFAAVSWGGLKTTVAFFVALIAVAVALMIGFLLQLLEPLLWIAWNLFMAVSVVALILAGVIVLPNWLNLQNDVVRMVDGFLVFVVIAAIIKRLFRRKK